MTDHSPNISDRDSRILTLHRQGIASRLIAERFGINPKTVTNIIRRAKAAGGPLADSAPVDPQCDISDPT
jgi:hypothetical protein